MLQATIHAQVQPTIAAKVTAQVQPTIAAKVTAQLGGASSYETYAGPYEAEPDFTGQTLPTKGKVMQGDVTVQPIAVASVSNTAGGRTIYIGGASNARE